MKRRIIAALALLAGLSVSGATAQQETTGGQTFTYLAAFNVALSILGVVMGWALKNTSDRLKELHDDSKELRRDMAQLNVQLLDKIESKSDKSTADHIFNALRRIEDKVDRKLDAPVRFKPTSDFAPLDNRRE